MPPSPSMFTTLGAAFKPQSKLLAPEPIVNSRRNVNNFILLVARVRHIQTGANIIGARALIP